jgi:hypothetical protein
MKRKLLGTSAQKSVGPALGRKNCTVNNNFDRW